ncbi:RDD family protein [Streptomyces harbinensis]|uniref:RDD family protein n=1 Tax=Streptomyces harbinensis TaxID=1176198 RepID=UPI0034DFD7E2
MPSVTVRTGCGAPPPSGEVPGAGRGAYGVPDPLAGMPPLASLGRRLVARIIDALIIGIPMSLILWGVTGDRSYDDGSGGSYLQQAAIIIVYFVYDGAMLSARGQTLGKMAMRIRVAMLADGAVPRGNPGWIRAAVYSLPQLVPCFGFIFWLVNVLTCTWDRPGGGGGGAHPGVRAFGRSRGGPGQRTGVVRCRGGRGPGGLRWCGPGAENQGDGDAEAQRECGDAGERGDAAGSGGQEQEERGDQDRARTVDDLQGGRMRMRHDGVRPEGGVLVCGRGATGVHARTVRV